MRYLLILLLSISLYGAGFWTLTGVEKANIYLQNGIDYIEPQTLETIKAKMKAMLSANSIETDKQDSATLMIELKEIVDDEEHYVYVSLALGEEVSTFRKNRDGTYAKTYDSSDFFETDMGELDEDILESVDLLLDQFAEHFEDDKE